MDDIAAFESALAAEEAARWAEPAPAPTEPAAKPVQADTKPAASDPAATDATDAPEPSAEELAAREAEAAAEAEEASVANRIKRSHIEAREAKKRAKLLEQELAVLRGTRSETRDETVQREVEQRAQEMAAIQLFNNECERVASAGSKDYKDFSETMAALWDNLGGFNRPLVEAAFEAGEAHKTLRYLGKNLDEAERIANLPPTRQGAAIARIAAQVSTPKVKPVSKAPPPINPVSGGATGSEPAQPDLDKMSMAQVAKYWATEDRKRRAERLGG